MKSNYESQFGTIHILECIGGAVCGFRAKREEIRYFERLKNTGKEHAACTKMQYLERAMNLRRAIHLDNTVNFGVLHTHAEEDEMEFLEVLWETGGTLMPNRNYLKGINHKQH